jgi:hypothetical protein
LQRSCSIKIKQKCNRRNTFQKHLQ